MGQYSLDDFPLLRQKGKQSAVNSVISIHISLGKACPTSMSQGGIILSQEEEACDGEQ